MGRTATRNLPILSPSVRPLPLPVHKHDDHIFPLCIFLHFLLEPPDFLSSTDRSGDITALPPLPGPGSVGKTQNAREGLR